MILFEYKYFIYFLVFCILLTIIIYFLSYFIINKKIDYEKLSAYECGFYPFEDARSTFDIKFYLVAILFIIFDLEIIFLFPWAVTIKTLDLFGIIAMGYFLLILTIGFIYEGKKGALEGD